MSVAADVRGPVYFPVTSRLMDSDVVLMRMAGVNWEVKELCSQHSGYVDLMLRVSRLVSPVLLGMSLPRVLCCGKSAAGSLILPVASLCGDGYRRAAGY